ncbi:MAG: protein translocase subunit SecF [Prochlorothrix sp.]|nr:protein translocase subunit SecF [Prochlorothrix sp.]
MRLNIIQQRKLWWLISATLMVLSLGAMAFSWATLGSPVRLGLDFIGGTRLQLERACDAGANCSTPLTPGDLRSVLAEQDLASSSVQVLGSEGNGILIRTGNLNVDQRTELEQNLAAAFGPFDPAKTQIDTVGPVIGKRLLIAGILSLLISFLGIVIYLTVRFQLDYAVLAMLALFHDALITTGVFSLLGLSTGLEIDSLFLVALLTIVGFSVNDTVVIYDRIRETIQINPNRPIDLIVDEAVNQTLGRSINTTLTTLLPLVSIFFLGGTTLKDFALALIVGFILGAYSSIFVASSLLSWWRERSQPPADPNLAPESLATDAIDAPPSDF